MEQQSGHLSVANLPSRDPRDSSISPGSTSCGTQHTELTQLEEPPAKKPRQWYEGRFEPVAIKQKGFSNVFVMKAELPGERPET